MLILVCRSVPPVLGLFQFGWSHSTGISGASCIIQGKHFGRPDIAFGPLTMPSTNTSAESSCCLLCPSMQRPSFTSRWFSPYSCTALEHGLVLTKPPYKRFRLPIRSWQQGFCGPCFHLMRLCIKGPIASSLCWAFPRSRC